MQQSRKPEAGSLGLAGSWGVVLLGSWGVVLLGSWGVVLLGSWGVVLLGSWGVVLLGAVGVGSRTTPKDPGEPAGPEDELALPLLWCPHHIRDSPSWETKRFEL